MTALTDMAAPARPGISEARVPCPLCGGLIHPVAGRCKHCKEDLTSFRAGRPQAAAVLPSLVSNGHGKASNGHVAAPIAVAKEASQPILPPRESMSLPAAREQPSAWRRWPIVVMVLAALAIVGAVVVMVWLPPSSGERARALPPPPAPEHMQTNPLSPNQLDQQQPQQKPDDDPWGPPPPHAQVRPRQAPDPADPNDPFASPHGNAVDPLAQALAGTNADFIAQFGNHVCDRLAACGMAHEPMVTSYCTAIRQLGQAASGAPTCDAARRCLQHVDQLSCSAQTSDVTAIGTLMTQIPDCLDALRC